MPSGIDRATAEQCQALLNQLFIVQRLPAWSHSDLKRLEKASRSFSGLASAASGATAACVANNRALFGFLLEAFVIGELRQHAGWSDGRYRLSHYRDKDGAEVDVVIEDEQRQLVGIEIKASATVTAADMRGLARLRHSTCWATRALEPVRMNRGGSGCSSRSCTTCKTSGTRWISSMTTSLLVVRPRTNSVSHSASRVAHDSAPDRAN